MLASTHGLCGVPHGRVLDMRDDDGMQMVSASEYPYDDDGVPEYRWADLTHVPDLTDPATLGCLLALVRKAWNDPQMCTYGRGLWDVVSKSEQIVTQDWESEAEALVAALEAAP